MPFPSSEKSEEVSCRHIVGDDLFAVAFSANLVYMSQSHAHTHPLKISASELFPNNVSAVSEANGKAVPVSLDLRSSLSIQPLEGSRSRVRRTRGAMGIQSISV